MSQGHCPHRRHHHHNQQHQSHLTTPHNLTCFLLQIHKAKAEKARELKLKEEMDAKRAKTKAARERRQERVNEKRLALTADDEEKKA